MGGFRQTRQKWLRTKTFKNLGKYGEIHTLMLECKQHVLKQGMLRRCDGMRNSQAVADQGDPGHGFNHRDAVRRDDL